MSINDIISIIIPCYNDAVYIEEAVQSAISQTWGNKEIIVVDDGSNMETKRVLKELEPKIDLLITQENKGLSAARNIGIENAKGDFIVLLDSDDFFEPEFCEKALPIISEDKSVKIVTCYARRFNENGVIDIFKPAGGDIKNFLGYNAAIGNSMIRKQDWGLVGKYDESMQEGFEDWEFYIRLLKPGGYAYVLEEALFNYRQKKKSMRGSANKIKYELQKYIYFKHQNLYKQYFEVFVEHLLGKIEREEREKIKHTQRLEFRLGKAFLNPLRRIKKDFKMVTLHKKPEVSIIMATYNRAHLIHESLTSIQNQTFENWECIIIDDGSTDETKEAIKPSLSDSRFRYLPRSAKHKKGLPGCRNYGIELAKGDYIVFFDDDDIAHPNHFKITIPILKKNDFHFCHYTREVFFGEFNREFNRNLNYSSKHIDYKNLEKIITHELPFNSCAVIWKKECFFNNRFNEELLYAEEWELYSRLLSNGFTGISIDKTLYFGRKHNASNTGEFYLGDKIRRESKIKAIQLVAINLQEKELLTPFLTRYFIQLAFLLNDRALINFLGKLTNLSRTKIYRYQVIRRYYPLISKYLRFKKKYL